MYYPFGQISGKNIYWLSASYMALYTQLLHMYVYVFACMKMDDDKISNIINNYFLSYSTSLTFLQTLISFQLHPISLSISVLVLSIMLVWLIIAQQSEDLVLLPLYKQYYFQCNIINIISSYYFSVFLFVSLSHE